jgi:hypothetical protein
MVRHGTRLSALGLLLVLILGPPGLYAQVTITGPSSTLAVPNDPTVGTTLNSLAKIDTTGAKLATTTDTAKPLYVVTGGQGTSAAVFAILAQTGTVSCTMDVTLASTRGMYVVQSPTTDGRCHPLNPIGTAPSSGYVVGIMHDTSTTAGQPALIEATQINFTPGSGTGTGTVQQVAMTVPVGGPLTISGTPITVTGTLALNLSTQSANCVMAGPATGAPAVWGCRSLVVADLPATVAAGTIPAGGDLVGSYPSPNVAKASGTFALSPVRATLGGPGNDYTGCANQSICILDPQGADRILTGLSNGTDGRLLPVCNAGTANTITLANDQTSSNANRFLFGASVTLRPGACKTLWYDAGTVNRWRLADGGLLNPYGVRTCTIPFGSTQSSAPPLASDDDVVAACGNNTGFDWVITGVKVYVATKATTSATSFLPKLTGGADIVTPACEPTFAGQWKDCALNGTPIVHSFSGAGSATCTTPPCDIAANIQLADGTGTYGVIELTGPLK